MIFNAEQDLHTGEVVGSIPTAPTIFQGFSRHESEQTGTNRQRSARSDVELTWNVFGVCSYAASTTSISRTLYPRRRSGAARPQCDEPITSTAS
jgi:hypothetical protein